MLPILFNFGPVKIYTFGVFLMLAFFWGSFLLWKNIRLTSYKEEDVFDCLFLSLGGGLFLARLVYVLLNFKEFGFDFLKFILINGYPGFSLYGFLFGFILSFWIFSKYKKINFLEISDYLSTPFFTALVFGKFASFFSGEEIGTKTNFFLKIKYFGFDGFRHLTPFYEAVFFLAGAFLSYKILFEIRKEKLFKGFLFYFSLWYFSLIIFLFDKLKENQLYFVGFSFNKLVSLILLLTTSIFFIYYFKSNILSFFSKYGQKIIAKIHFRAKRKTS